MSLGKDTFVEFRKRVLDETKKRLLDSTNSNVSTISHISAVLEKSSMVAGKISYIVFNGKYLSR
jgi:hypothetical protein